MTPSNGSVRPSRKSTKTSWPPRTSQLAEREAGHRRDHDRHRDHAEHDQHARLEDRAHVGGLEGVDEVAPVRMRRPVEPVRVRPRLVEGRREQARERQQVTAISRTSSAPPAEPVAPGDDQRRSLSG